MVWSVMSERTACQRIFDAVVQPADIVAAVPLLVDFQKGADQQFRSEVLDREADGLRGFCKAPVSERLPPRYAPARRKQFGRRRVVEFRHRRTLALMINNPLNISSIAGITSRA